MCKRPRVDHNRVFKEPNQAENHERYDKLPNNSVFIGTLSFIAQSRHISYTLAYQLQLR